MGYIVLPQGSTDPIAGTYHAEGTPPQEIAAEGLVDLYYKIASGDAGTAPAGGFDFTASPYTAPSADVSATDLGGGDWRFTISNSNADANMGWNIGTTVPGGASGEWSITLESSVDILAGELYAIRGGNSALTQIRGVEEEITLTAGVPKTFTFSHSGSDEVRYHGFDFRGPSKGPSWTLDATDQSLGVV